MSKLTVLPDYPGYGISPDGRVYSALSGKWLSPSPNSRGYLRINLAPTYKFVFVHRLVALAWLPSPGSEQWHVAHNDGDHSNNDVSNLRWATPSENELDKIRHGTDHNVNKTHCPQGHPYSVTNTYVYLNRRSCRECIRQRNREYKRRKRSGINELGADQLDAD